MSSSLPPRAPGRPPVRGLAAARRYTAFFRDPIASLLDTRSRTDLLALGRVLPWVPRERYLVFALSPAYNREVLGSPDLFRTTGQALPGPRGSAQRRLRYGLTRSQGERHREQRQLLLPSFQRPAAEAASGVMARAVAGQLETWKPGTVVDLAHESQRMALRISSELIFGSADPGRSYRLGGMIEEWLARNFSASVWLAPVDAPGTPYRRLLAHAERIEREILALVEATRRDAGASDTPLAALIGAYDAGEPWMTARDLVGQIAILFGASYETTASALTWTSYLIAQHRRVAGELVDELSGRLAGEAPDAGSLSELPRLDAAIRESMRILPPVPYTLRAVNRETGLGDFALRRGDRVICSHYVTHHDPELYPEPESFRPERWAELRRGPYEYLPFSAGPRTCLGGAFATTALKVTLSLIWQRFRLRVVPGARIDRKVNVTLAPRGGLPVEIHPPDGRFEASQVSGDIAEMVEPAIP